MDIFVTGATGFVGRHLVRELANRGHRVTVLARSQRRAALIEAPLQRVLLGDLQAGSILQEGISGCHAVIHLAATLTGVRYSHFERVNVDGTRRLLDAASRVGGELRRFLHVSSLAAAGPNPPGTRGEKPERARVEEDPCAPISLYGRSKLAAEELVSACAERFPVTILRPPGVYGPGDQATLFFFRMASRGTIWLPGNAAIPLSLIHVEDLARGIAAALEQGREQVETYYLSGAELTSLGEVLAEIAAAFGRSIRIRRVPRAVVQPLALAAEAWSLLSRRPSFLNRDKLRELAARGWWCSARRAQEMLGWQAAIPLREGLRATAAWYREQGWL